MTDVDRVAPEELVAHAVGARADLAAWLTDAAQYITRLEGTIARNNREAGDALADAEIRRSHAEQEVKRLEGENERLRTGRDQAIIALDRGAEYERMARTALTTSSHSAPKEEEDGKEN